jgi:TetR/AcrR family transcriptional regulator, transcriptional repressor for nem operon
MPVASAVHTADRILDIAERLVQTRGFNAFSYGDIADELGVKAAAIHYHFASKDILGKALVVRYRRGFHAHLDALDKLERAMDKLRGYTQLYIEVLKQDERLCLCAMMAADFMTLPGPMRSEVKRFFEDNESWLAKVLNEGQGGKELHFQGNPDTMARLMLDALEGGMLVSRCHGEVARFRAVANQLLALIEIRA